MEAFTIEGYSQQFRIKKMNAIEALALQSQISFDSVEDTQNLYNSLLERLEVECKDKWLPVKEKGRDVFYPAGIEEDIPAIQSLIKEFLNYLKPLFTKSNASKKTQE